jgi:hypothetical protein
MSKNKEDDIINENYKSKNIILDYESDENNYENDNYDIDDYEEYYEEYCNDTIDIIYKELVGYINSKDLFVGEYLTTKAIENFIKNNKIIL